MKKFVIIVMCFVLLGSSIAALAEEFSVDGYTLDELLVIQQTVDDEINKRLNQQGGEPFFSGTYIVGQDIKPGSYQLTYVKKTNNSYVNVLVMNDMESYQKALANDNFEGMISKASFQEGESMAINLAEGNILIIRDVGEFTIQAINTNWNGD